MKTHFEIEGLSGTYNAGPKVEREVFNKLIEFFKKHECFSGECMMQSDAPQLEAPEFLADLLDKVLKFEIELH